MSDVKPSDMGHPATDAELCADAGEIEDLAQRLPIGLRRPPVNGGNPILVIHVVVGAEAKDIEAIASPRKSRRCAKKYAAKCLPTCCPQSKSRTMIHLVVGAEAEDMHIQRTP